MGKFHGKNIKRDSLPPTPVAKKATNSVAAFRNEHIAEVSIPNKIRAGLAKMKTDGQAWYYQADFARVSGVKPSDLNDYAGQFKDQVHELPGSRGKLVWFVSAAAKNQALAPANE
jgi:hypothetical protein